MEVDRRAMGRRTLTVIMLLSMLPTPLEHLRNLVELGPGFHPIVDEGAGH